MSMSFLACKSARTFVPPAPMLHSQTGAGVLRSLAASLSLSVRGTESDCPSQRIPHTKHLGSRLARTQDLDVPLCIEPWHGREPVARWFIRGLQTELQNPTPAPLYLVTGKCVQQHGGFANIHRDGSGLIPG
ncbi:hypothetical protein C8Q73DRAFT_783781 [Cubamyces lactineus]|nr:hypothetical protein C8Q73DRAFT_783781 [Cubamyces lactineus]